MHAMNTCMLANVYNNYVVNVRYMIMIVNIIVIIILSFCNRAKFKSAADKN